MSGKGGSDHSELLIEPDELMRRIDSYADLTMLTTVALEAIEMAGAPNCSVPELVEVIEKDPRLVTGILTLSNSVAYQTRREVKSVQHAVMLVGLSQCQNLIVSCSIQSLLTKMPSSVEWARNVIWRHSLQTATLARYFNQQLDLGFEGEEFSGAIVHDIGRLLLAAAAPDVFEVVDRMTFHEPRRILQTERALIGTDHCEMGAIVGVADKLPAALVEVIRYHHTPEEAREHAPLVRLVAAADEAANRLMHYGTAEGFEIEDDSAFAKFLQPLSISWEEGTRLAVEGMWLVDDVADTS